MFIVNASSRIFGGISGFVGQQFTFLGVMLWDSALTLGNLFAFKRPVGKVIAAGVPGHGGKWPGYIPPSDTDSRSCCPALNAMANHGILPRDGRNIPYPLMGTTIRQTFNFAASFCFFVPNYAAGMLSRDYKKDTIDLSDLNVHNGIEHDASLTRHDIVRQPDQSKPALDLIDDLLAAATGPNGTLTVKDLSVISGKRRRESKATNGQFTLSTFHKMFGSSNSSTLLAFFGGNIADLEVFLKEERFPDGWEPKVRAPFGLTITTFNRTVFKMELGIDERARPIAI